MLDGLRGEESIAELCRIESTDQGLYINGRRILWRLARNDWPETSCAKPTPVRLKD